MSDYLIENLEARLTHFEDGSWNLNTAKDLINTWRHGKVWNGRRLPAGRFSDKQRALVQKLIDRADKVVVAPVTIDVGNFATVVSMFEHAKSRKLKFPKIELLIEGIKVRLYMATDKSRNPGHIQVKNETRYYGNVSPEGALTWYNQEAPHKDQIIEILRRFGRDPVGVAVEYGKVTGNCCFCRTALGRGEDKRSVKVGYGPVCAEKWNLPWGTTYRTGEHCDH